jgi:hypothetical protein
MGDPWHVDLAMRVRAWAAVLGVSLAALPPGSLRAADAVSTLQGFSLFTKVDLPRLVGGEVLTERGPLTDFRRGISGQSCYVVRKPPAAVAAYIQTSSPSTTNAADSVYFHTKVAYPAKDSDLDGMSLEMPKSDVRRLVDRTLSVTSKSTDFCMGREEAARIEALVREGKARGAAPAQVARQAWAGLLLARIREFQEKGLANVSPYDMERTPVRPSDEMRSLLAEEPEVQAQFRGLLEETGILPSKEGARLKAVCYAELMNAQIVSTFDLGAVFVKPMANGEFQVLDAQYFSSNAYYVMLTLFHLWPVEGGSATLVWRGDFLSASLLDVTRGTARMAWGLVMMREIKQSIQNFQKGILRDR